MADNDTLFDTLIVKVPIVSGLVDAGPVPVPHTGEAVYSIDRDGRKWVRKREDNTGCEEVLAEVIGWLFGRAIGAPVPDGAISSDEDGRSWLSSLVPDVVHWNAAFAGRLANVEELGSILCLDALLHNPDRHAGNLLVQPVDSVDVRVWAIDQGQALVGWPDDFAAAIKEVPPTRNLAPGLPIDLLDEPAMRAAEKATELPRQAIMAMVTGACLVTQEPQVDVIGQTLVARCADAVPLVRAYLNRIRQSVR